MICERYQKGEATVHIASVVSHVRRVSRPMPKEEFEALKRLGAILPPRHEGSASYQNLCEPCAIAAGVLPPSP
jgi:hypothetical protein